MRGESVKKRKNAIVLLRGVWECLFTGPQWRGDEAPRGARRDRMSNSTVNAHAVHFRALCSEGEVDYYAACCEDGFDFGGDDGRRYRAVLSSEGVSLLDRDSATRRRLSSDETLESIVAGDA
jgi:hypothetical protein